MYVSLGFYYIYFISVYVVNFLEPWHWLNSCAKPWHCIFQEKKSINKKKIKKPPHTVASHLNILSRAIASWRQIRSITKLRVKLDPKNLCTTMKILLMSYGQKVMPF